MFNSYLATQEDLEVIGEGLRFVLHPKMHFVFKDISRIANTAVISYDSKFIYMWKVKPIKLSYKIPHNFKVSDKWQEGWWASIISKDIEKLIPEIKNNSVINGGLLTPFIRLQKNKKIKDNPYTTKESYLATIIHEFGHIYWNSYKLWWLSDKIKNLSLLEEARSLYLNMKANKKIRPILPMSIYTGEVFAHCAEYYASQIFWPGHKEKFDKYAVIQINEMTKDEKNKKLDFEDSVLEPTKNQHNYSLVVGKLLISSHSKDWPRLLTKY